MITGSGPGHPPDGVPLRQLIRRDGALSPQAALLVLRRTLIGLPAALSIVTPDNVLLYRDGRSELTPAGLVADTRRQAPYRAPELADGVTRSEASDLYAATAVFFECLTGLVPSAEHVARFRHGQLPGAESLGPAHEPLARLIAWGLAANPLLRPAATRDLLGALDELAGRTAAVLTPRAGPATRGRHPRARPRRRLLFPVVAAAVALVVFGVVGAALAVTGHLGSGPSAPGRPAAPSSPSVSPADGAPIVQAGTRAGGTAAVTADAVVTPAATTSTCSTPATFAVSGTVSAAAAGTVSYQWVYSAGPAGPVKQLTFEQAGTQHVTGRAVQSKTAGTGWAAIRVLRSGASLSNKATYTLGCSASPVTVSATASVTPQQSTQSCAAAPPAATFSGSIRDTKAGKVSYRWELPTGNGPTRTLTFSGPGTLPVTPVSVTAASDSATGSGVIVVLSPAAASSNTATFSVTCTQPAPGAPSVGVQLSTGQPVPATVSCSSAPPAFVQRARITSDKTAVETYHWVRPDGTVTDPATVTLHGGGTASVTDAFTPARDKFSGTETLVFTGPAQGSWGIGLSLNCSAAAPTAPASPSPTASASGTPGSPPLTIAWSPVGGGEAGTAGTPFSASFTAQGGRGPYAWTAANLPAGLAIDPVTGTISGTPTTAGSSGVTVTVTDSESPAQSTAVAIGFVIRDAPVQIASVILPDGTVGSAYPAVSFSAAGGDGTYTWTAAAPLPDGLSLSADGVLSGTPTTAGTFTVSVSVTDGETSPGFDRTQLTLVINAS